MIVKDAQREIPATEQEAPAREISCPPRPWWRRFLSRRLLITPQYCPRPLHVPRYYFQNRVSSPAPVISVVTPSYNHGAFLRHTMDSVVQQDYPRLEYIVQDGGSTDNTLALLQRYDQVLSHWESTLDGGQTNALNRGFPHARGDILAYLNSDDMLLPGTLHYVANYFAKHPDVDVVYGHRVVIDVHNREVGRWVLPPHDNAILSWMDFIPQETLFWRRDIWEKIGACFDESFQFAMDWDLLLRFRDAGAKFVRLPRFLGAFRIHSRQKTVAQMDVGLQEMARLRQRCHGRTVTQSEIRRACRGYKNWHVVYDWFYRWGLVKY